MYSVNITDNLCTKPGNVSLKSAVYNQEGFKSRSGYNSACTVYLLSIEVLVHVMVPPIPNSKVSKILGQSEILLSLWFWMLISIINWLKDEKLSKLQYI